MAKMRNIIKSSAEYTESFYGFRGIAPEGDSSVKNRLAYCKNMYRDYESDCPGAIVSVPGYRKIADLSGVTAIFESHSRPIAEVGGNLFLVDERSDVETVKLIGSLQAPMLSHFSYGEYTYFTDGIRLTRLKKTGTVYTHEAPAPYIPLLYRNGMPVETRNLLTELANEEIDITDAREFTYESDGLRYSIVDDESFTCVLSGIDPSVSGEVSIPGFKTIGGVKYRVDEIAPEAFKNNTGITSLRIGEGVQRIRRMAFYGCSRLERVYAPVSLTAIDEAAFHSCQGLTEIYLGDRLSYIGNAAFALCYNLERVYYKGNSADFALIEGVNALEHAEKTFDHTDSSLSLFLPLKSGFTLLNSVKIDGEYVDFTVKATGDVIDGILLTLERSWQYNGARLEVNGYLPELYLELGGRRVKARGAVEGCRLAAAYDGRVFLSGNPSLPSTVFYNSLTGDPDASGLYFGEYNYLNDGTGSNPVSALLSVGGGLYVFKSKGDPMGEIFLHCGKDSGDELMPRIYPVSEVLSGEYAIGDAYAAPDGPIFLSPRGLSAIEKRTVNLERELTVRSSNVASHLLRERLGSAKIVEWMGYIAILCGERIYLADPRQTFIGRQGCTEYEWFIIDGVGAYRDKKRVYRYCSYATLPDFKLRTEMKDGVADGTVYELTRDGKSYFSVREDGVDYAVYPTEEYTYGSFVPATYYCTVGDSLVFTAGGGIYVFNNDRRDVPPSESYLAEKGLYEEEYIEAYGGRIHPQYYSFDGIAPEYVLTTVKTDCGVPHLTKSSVKSSLVIKLGAGSRCMPSCSVRTDKGKYSEFVRIGGGSLDFLETDFSRLALCPEMDHTVAVAEKEKDWIEKDVTVYSCESCAPLAVLGIAFRYKIKGRIKHT